MTDQRRWQFEGDGEEVEGPVGLSAGKEGVDVADGRGDVSRVANVVEVGGAREKDEFGLAEEMRARSDDALEQGFAD